MWLPAEMAVFARIVDLGSFTAAADALGVPKVAASRALRSLEARLGTPLLERTTRRLNLTPAGRALLPYCQRVAQQADAARQAMSALSPERSALRVLADPIYGRLLLGPLVPRFLERYPESGLQVEISGEGPPGTDEEWDVRLCHGAPSEENLVCTSLGTPPVILCAAPAYLKRHAAPQLPSELATHAILVAGESGSELRLKRGTHLAQIPLRPRLLINDPAVVHAATAAGTGIGVLPEFLCRQGLALGKLVRVLPQWWAADGLELYAVCRLHRVAAKPVTALIEFLRANMVPVLAGPA
jgi:DNA-binding transcriptional LysR family regulator